MEKNKKYSIRKLYLLLVAIGTFILLCIFSYIWIQDQNQFLKYQTSQLEKKLFSRENHLIKQEVVNIVNSIRYEDQIANRILKSELVQKVEAGYQVAKSLSEKYKDMKDEDLKELIKTAFRDVRFHGREYFFIADMDGNEILYPIKPELENTNVLDLQDSKGNFVVKEEVNLLKKKDRAFVRAYWSKNKDDKKEYLKVSFIRKLNIFNWFIGMGIYLDDFKKNLVKKMLFKFSKIKYGKSEHISIISYDGYSILDNGIIHNPPINILAKKSITWDLLKGNNLTNIKKKESGYIDYFKLSKDGVKIKRTSFFMKVDSLKWVIIANYSHVSVNKTITKAKKEFLAKFNRELRIFFIAITLLFVFLFIVFYILNKFLAKEFNIFLENFKNASLNKDLIDEDDVKFTELNTLVQGTNSIIKEKQILEEEVSKKRRLESLGILAGGIGHDFNNLLTAILGSINLSKNLNDVDEIKNMLSNAENASDRAKNLISQLLTFSKGGMLIAEVLSLPDFIKETTLFLLTGTNINTKYIFDDDLWYIDADKGQIGQVIENIIINAKQAMSDSGDLTIKLLNKNKTFDKKSVALKKYVQIQISDTGKGIDEKNIDKIFDPYFTTRKEGSGLGLSTTYSIIKKHDGIIKVESELGKGTKFKIYLPATEKTIPKESSEVKTKAKTKAKTKDDFEEVGFLSRGKKVLIMDDEDIILTISEKLFEHLGYEVKTVKKGEELLVEYKKSMDNFDKYDLVVMDLTIHDGMGAEKAIKELLFMDKEAIVVISSGYFNSPIVLNHKDHGFKASLVKPYRLNDVIRLLKELNT